MKYRFTKDFPPTSYFKGAILDTEDLSTVGKLRNLDLAILLELGVIEEVKESHVEGCCKCHDSKSGCVAGDDCDGKEESPIYGDNYYWIGTTDVWESFWTGSSDDKARRDFIGIYTTKSEALAVRDAIKAFVKERNEGV